MALEEAMQWTSVISRADATPDALADVVEQLWRRLDGAPDLVAAFSSRHHASSAAQIPPALAEAFADATIIGCSAYSVIGDGDEEEREPAITVTAARLPGVRLRTRVVQDLTQAQWLDELGADEVRALMVVLDSFSADTEAILAALDDRFPEAKKFGGLASGGIYPGANVLFAGDRALRSGAVVVSFAGDIDVETVVAQGCRPIGDPYIVTRHQDHVILEFDRGLPQVLLAEIYERLSPEDRRHIPAALHLGIQMRPHDDGVYRHGDYLIRPIMGIDPNSGALSVAEKVRQHDVVQFHLRDAKSSSTDLRDSLAQWCMRGGQAARGAMLFSCIGRGERLFGEPNHDASVFRETIGDVPLGGFFCAGEIGAVGDRTFLHGYTSTFALFRPAAQA